MGSCFAYPIFAPDQLPHHFTFCWKCSRVSWLFWYDLKLVFLERSCPSPTSFHSTIGPGLHSFIRVWVTSIKASQRANILRSHLRFVMESEKSGFKMKNCQLLHVFLKCCNLGFEKTQVIALNKLQFKTHKNKQN